MVFLSKRRMEAPKEENYHQAQGKWGKSIPWWCPKKNRNPPAKIIPFEFGNQAFKTEDLQMKLRHVWRIFARVGLETSKCPQEGLTYPTEAWECTSRTYITRSHWVCLFVWMAENSPLQLGGFFNLFSFLFIDSPFQISSIWFRVFFFLSHSVTIKLPCPSNMGKWTPRTAATPRKYMVFGTESRDAQVLPVERGF